MKKNRLTTDTPKNNLEMALNLFYVKDKEVWVREYGKGGEDISLFDLTREILSHQCPYVDSDISDDDLIMMMPEWLFNDVRATEHVIGLLYQAAWVCAELREHLKQYEDKEDTDGKTDDVITELRPRCVVGENVPGIIKIAAGQVVKNLERAGYHVVVFNFEAAAVGAWHRRSRVFFTGFADVADTDEDGLRKGADAEHAAESRQPTQPGLAVSGEAMADAARERIQRHAAICAAEQEKGSGEMQSDAESGNGADVCDTVCAGLQNRAAEAVRKPGPREQHQRSGWWAAEPDVGRVAHGIPARVDRLKCLGNAVVPQQAYPIFKALREEIFEYGKNG